MGKRFMAIISIATFFIGCKKEDVKVTIQNDNLNKIGAIVQFPDTVYRNEVNPCIVKYKGHFDTITTSFHDAHKRYIYFYFHNSKNIYTYKEFEKLPHDTIGANDNNTITIPGLRFSKLGVSYIDGIIQDMVFIAPSNTLAEEKTRYLENKWRVTRKVVVIERPKEKI